MEQAPSTSTKKVWESVRLYTVKCSKCSKWRLIPTKEKYEGIRETIEERSFTCETAREWRPEISCEDEADVVQQDSNYRWAMDRPSIPRTPRGWQRILRIRAEGGTKFADVYYVSPSNKRLRSTVEINRYLDEHPREGLNMSQFSFQSPLPLDENYVAKRRPHNMSIVPYEENQPNPISWIVPCEGGSSHSGKPEVTSSEVETHTKC